MNIDNSGFPNKPSLVNGYSLKSPITEVVGSMKSRIADGKFTYLEAVEYFICRAQGEEAAKLSAQNVCETLRDRSKFAASMRFDWEKQ